MILDGADAVSSGTSAPDLPGRGQAADPAGQQAPGRADRRSAFKISGGTCLKC
jgi:hypothetical protein